MLYNANHDGDPKEEYTTVFCWRFSPFHSFDALSYFQEKSKGSSGLWPIPLLSFIPQSLKALGNLHRSLEHEDTAHWLSSATSLL